MGYLDEYNARHGKCDFCKYGNHTGSPRCVECYGTAFEDSLDLYTFIRAKVSKDAVDKFNESDEGKQLFNLVEQKRLAYNESRDAYNKARDSFVDSELKRIEESINSIY
jgi:hypothetical protein